MTTALGVSCAPGTSFGNPDFPTTIDVTVTLADGRTTTTTLTLTMS